MANELANEVKVLWGDVGMSTDIKCTFSKMLDKFQMGDVEGARTDDRVWLPQEYRFEAQDGLTSSDADFQDLIDLMTPADRKKVKRIVFRIKAADLRDPMLKENAVKSLSKQVRNTIDIACTDAAIREAAITHAISGNFDWQTVSDIEVLMADRGLDGYDKKAFLSLPHYSGVAKELGAYQYNGNTPSDALEKAKLPMLQTFETIRADYRSLLEGNATTGVTVNGDQSHTPRTYVTGSETEFYDSRYMTLNVLGATVTDLPYGTKLSITGVESLNPETRNSTGEAFTCTVKGGTGSALQVSPPIITSGPYRNASAVAANGAAVNVLNTTTCAPSVFYTDDAIMLVPGQLPLGGPGVDEVVSTTENGIPLMMTFTKDFHTGDLHCKGAIFFDVTVRHPERVLVCLDNQ
jgi:hypothetical protein